MNSNLTPLSAVQARRNPLIRLFSSIWLAVTLLALIVIYSSVVSAFAPVRWALEMTEMQAFRHWLFVMLVVLFLVALSTATFLRTRWNRINAGALTAHLGLLLLSVGALAYFGTKVEGDVLLRSPAIVVRANVGGSQRVIGRFRAGPHESWSRILPPLNEPITLHVVETAARGVEPVATATVSVQSGTRPPQTVTLSNAPDDWQPVHEMLALHLETSLSQSSFYDDETPALYIRDAGTGLEYRRKIERLPIYREHYPAADGILRDARGTEVPSKRVRPELSVLGLRIPTNWFEPWRMPIDVNADGLPFTIQITGYVPCVAGLQPVRSPDGRMRNEPVLEVRENRRADVSPRSMSAIQLKLIGRDAQASWTETQWCAFSSYPDVDVHSITVGVPGPNGSAETEIRRYEIVYSRARHDLGATLAARNLSVTYFPGQRGIESFHSEIMVQQEDGLARPATVSTNQTLDLGRWTLYQSGFDFDSHWSYTVLGVGNRIGIMPMNIGWIIVTLGCLYAFYVKPVLLRRVKTLALPALAIGLSLLLPGCGKPPTPYSASQAAAGLDRQINWTDAQLISVQDNGRYKTLDSFARESFAAMTGKEHLPGLTPLASLLEWLFHRDAYVDTPLIRVKETELCVRLAAHMNEADRQRVLTTKRFTPRELADPAVERVLSQAETRPLMRRAANRVRTAQAIAENLERMTALVPQPGGDVVAAWFTPPQIVANLSDEQLAQMGLTRAALPRDMQVPVPNVTPDQALAVTVNWTSLRAAWLTGDAAGVQSYLERLSKLLPTLAGPGVYPSRSQGLAEVRYYALGKFTWGWMLYFVAFLFSIWALVTGWRFPRVITLLLLTAGLIWHGYGLSLRWYILGRIPVANMFEAVVASAWMGIAAAILIELFIKMRILLVGAAALGFLALVIAGYMLPGAELSAIPGILDHVQLRIHTVLISFSYALIFLAAVVALVYLIGYYAVRVRPGAIGSAPAVSLQRPILAGAAPGDEGGGANLPQWLNNIDWSHLIILNLVFVMLFVGGIIMGAIWANESWGRPWGWDPKEVFALNTWLIYAILIHVRFVVRDRGLWTAWLSIAGCAMMAFNWFFVNFFINSVHSYA